MIPGYDYENSQKEPIMFKRTVLVFMSLTFILAACIPMTAGQDKMMDSATEVMDKPTDAMPEAMMEDKPTDAMPEAMMEDKPTDAMPETMMEDKPTEEMMASHTSTPDAMMSDESATPEAMGEDKMEDKMMEMEMPAWFGVTLNNARTGENFTINDYQGKVVLVENLAMWCPNCKKQQMEVKALQEAMMGDMGKDLVLIGLDIDPNENAADLKTYTEMNGFDWIYAIAPADVAREIGQLYGDQFLNPTSTPILVIDRKGQVHPMPFGIKSADDLKMFIEPFLNAGM